MNATPFRKADEYIIIFGNVSSSLLGIEIFH